MKRDEWLNKWKTRRAKILSYKETHSYTETSAQYGLSVPRLQRLIKKARKEATV